MIIKRSINKKISLKQNIMAFKRDFNVFRSKVKAMDHTPLYLAVILFGALAILAITKVIKDSYEMPAMSLNEPTGIERNFDSYEGLGIQSQPTPLAEAIDKKLSADPILASSDLVVTSRNGLVQLSGDLKSEDEASKAVEIAYSVPGVIDVDTSHLTVIYNLPSEDMIITGKVKGIYQRYRLFGDKTMEEVGLHVETHNGVVSLMGTVHTEKQAKNAIKFAKIIPGVNSVVSQMAIFGKGSATQPNKHSKDTHSKDSKDKTQTHKAPLRY